VYVVRAGDVVLDVSYGGRADVRYHPVATPEAKNSRATRVSTQTVTLISRRFGALTDLEVRSLREPRAARTPLTELPEQTAGVVVWGSTRSRDYHAPTEAVTGTFVRLGGTLEARLVIMKTTEGERVTVHKPSPHVLVYPEGAHVRRRWTGQSCGRSRRRHGRP